LAALNSAAVAYLAPPGHHAGFAVGIGTLEQPPLQGETHSQHFPLISVHHLPAAALIPLEVGAAVGALVGAGVG